MVITNGVLDDIIVIRDILLIDGFDERPSGFVFPHILDYLLALYHESLLFLFSQFMVVLNCPTAFK